MTALSIRNMNFTVGTAELEGGKELTAFERITLKLELAYKLQGKNQDEANRLIGNNLEASALHELLEIVDADPSHNWGEPSDDYKNSQPYHNEIYPYL